MCPPGAGRRTTGLDLSRRLIPPRTRMTWLERISDVHAGSDRLAVADASGAVTGRELIGKAVAAAEYLTALDVADGCAVPALLTINADALALLIGGVAQHAIGALRAEADGGRTRRDGRWLGLGCSG